MDVCLKPYSPDMFDDMVCAIAQESFLGWKEDDPRWKELLPATLDKRGIKRSFMFCDEEEVLAFAERHGYLVDDFIEEMATMFDVEPEFLLGRELVFEVFWPPEETI